MAGCILPVQLRLQTWQEATGVALGDATVLRQQGTLPYGMSTRTERSLPGCMRIALTLFAVEQGLTTAEQNVDDYVCCNAYHT